MIFYYQKSIIIIISIMKLSTWAKKYGIHYQTAWRWFRDGKMPVHTEQMPSGTIIVFEDEKVDLKKEKNEK
jgi:predicted site-specific integrase-resolvase